MTQSSTRVFIFEYVTGGGMAGNEVPSSLAVEGHAMRRALVAEFRGLGGVEVTHTIDERYRAEGEESGAIVVGAADEEATYRRLAAEADYTLVVAPETDLCLFDRAEALVRLGATSIGSTPQAIRVAGNKYEMACLFDRVGVATPRTFWRGEVDPLADDLRLHFQQGSEPGDHRPRFPVVLKSNDGAGSVRTFVVDDPNAIPSGAEGDILQEFVAGQPMSASFLVGPDGTPHLVGIGRQIISIREGVVSYLGGELPADSDWIDGAVEAAVRAVPGLRGWVGVDYVWSIEERRALVLEINPRVTTSFVGLSALVPSGTLARAWLDLWRESRADSESEAPLAASLAGLIASKPSLRFDPDGTIYRKA